MGSRTKDAYTTRNARMREYGRGARRELGSLAAVTGLGTWLLPGEFFADVRDTVHFGRHALRTTGEMAGYGPAGQVAVEKLQAALRTLERDANAKLEELVSDSRDMSLSSALSVVGTAAKENVSARQALNGYFDARMGYVDKLAETYQRNETLGRQAERLATQIEGVVVRGTAAYKKVAEATGWAAVENWVLKVTGRDPAKERKAFDEKLDPLYREVLKFYHAREKNEDTLRELCDHLRTQKGRSVQENARLNKDLDTMLGQLDATYVTEDRLFSMTDKVGAVKTLLGKRKNELLSLEDVAATGKSVKKYKVGVDDARTQVSRDMPLEPYAPGGAWIDIAANPVTIALAGAIALKAATKFVLPRSMYHKVTSATLLPFYLLRGAGRLAVRAGSKKSKNRTP